MAEDKQQQQQQEQRPVLEVVQVVPDKVVKHIFRHGASHGDDSDGDSLMVYKRSETPPNGVEVSVHYVGRLASNGTVFDSSRDRGEPFKFTLGQNRVIKGWEAVVPTMRRGELADVTIASDYAYGKQGSPPNIPGDADLIFEIELLDWKEEEDVTPDFEHEGAILKKSLPKEDDAHQESEKEPWKKPSEGSKCVIKYSVRVLDPEDPMKFSSQYPQVVDSHERFEVTLGEEQIWRGLEACVESLSKSEHALFRILDHLDIYGLSDKVGRQWAAKYGIPEDSKLFVDMTLLEFEPEKSKWDMSNEEKFEACERKRQEGNAFFKEKRYSMAFKRYQKALDYVSNEYDFHDDESKKRSRELALLCHSNLATVCHVSDPDVHNLESVIHHATKALEIDGDNVKCLFRRARASREQKDLDTAMKDLKRALELEPSSKALQLEMRKTKEALKIQEQKERAVYSRMFQ